MDLPSKERFFLTAIGGGADGWNRDGKSRLYTRLRYFRRVFPVAGAVLPWLCEIDKDREIDKSSGRNRTSGGFDIWPNVLFYSRNNPRMILGIF